MALLGVPGNAGMDGMPRFAGALLVLAFAAGVARAAPGLGTMASVVEATAVSSLNTATASVSWPAWCSIARAAAVAS
ncbi:hypothetical protein, partial [Xanthomonas translucens]|uniref:hypothetical protein n=1 Tax=Xanthomonas campestris pv. translucens TaxID=343 RepID=UPI001C400155